MVGPTTTRAGGGSWTCLVGNVKDMSRSGRELSAPTLATAGILSIRARVPGALTVLYHIRWIGLKLPYLGISMEHRWPKSRMRFDLRRQELEITCALCFNVQTARARTFEAETSFRITLRMRHLNHSSSELHLMPSGLTRLRRSPLICRRSSLSQSTPRLWTS